MESSPGNAASKPVASWRKTSWSTQATLALELTRPRSTRLLTGWLNLKASGYPSISEAGAGSSTTTHEGLWRRAPERIVIPHERRLNPIK